MEALIPLIVQYGPQLVLELISAIQKPDATLQDVSLVLGKFITYDQGIVEANIRAGKPADAPVIFK